MKQALGLCVHISQKLERNFVWQCCVEIYVRFIFDQQIGESLIQVTELRGEMLFFKEENTLINYSPLKLKSFL